MSALPGNYSESSERSSEGTQCRLCMKKNDYYYNIFTSNVACRVTVKDAMHGLLGLEVAVGDGLPTILCPVCLKKLTEFSVFKKICLESDEKLRKFSGINYFGSIQGDEAADDKLGSSADTKDCIQDVIEGTSHLTCSIQTTEIYIPVPDSHQSRANMLCNLKEEDEDPLSGGNYSVMHTTDPAITSTDASDPLATDDWTQASTSSQGEVVDSNGKETIVIDLDSLLVLAKRELSSNETDATEPTGMESEALIQNRTMAMESMTEAVELPAPVRASAFFALLEPKIGASRSRKGKKVKKETLSIGKDVPLKSLAPKKETVSSSQPTSSKSLNQLLCKRQVMGQKGNRILKENLGGTRQKKNVRQARTRFILDGKSCTGSRNIAKKSYSCHGYEKSFSQKSDLVRHIRTHTKEKPYSCNDCDKFKLRLSGGNPVFHLVQVIRDEVHVRDLIEMRGNNGQVVSVRPNGHPSG
ncbi:zinc finger protein 184-like [Ischnura elegans]|uniref:zinc finger protein 184-like n=1 Tax=Ischnura elegans TaxID=197161 RepID=UPI001ED86FE1|nr:zinc finger protein 184-like [Ischnura elegans]